MSDDNHEKILSKYLHCGIKVDNQKSGTRFDLNSITAGVLNIGLLHDIYCWGRLSLGELQLPT
ncbi:CLUMA_CG000417, isoform A [Clunio marinus]|uniref:CLUMA_CG000417, isoform A n=1 Tax=Clunio marinus TaxID=568069 RepID=A0A1J1HFG0_9DIPT|nr:CLUMA_CG000417, isoform A [Clunio marinus]